MKSKIMPMIIATTVAILIAGFVFAGGMGGGRGWGGGGHGMMGGGHMMDYGRGYSNPYQAPYNRDYQPYNRDYQSNGPQRYNTRETERLRQEIREKRQKLSALYRSDNPDPDQIDKKIDELSRLEAELDQKTLGR